MYGNNDNAIRVVMVVDTIFAVKASEAPVNQLRIEGFVPHPTALFHTIKIALEFPDMILEARLDESLQLLHVAYLVEVQDTVEEGGLDVKLFDFPVKSGTNVSEDMEGFHAHCGGCSFCIILTIDCSITLTDVLCLKMGGIPMFVMFEFENDMAS